MTSATEYTFLAGGCYFITQHLLRQPEGVISTRVGWMGGDGDNPTETNSGGHTEVVEVTFDPTRLTFRKLVEYFLVIHRADLGQEIVGSIYRSEIFCTSAAQRAVAQETVRAADASGYWPGRLTTRISVAGRFWPGSPEDHEFLTHFTESKLAHFRDRQDTTVHG
ncbi:peptide-methionine (S)-S-oxide reductase [Frigidibacter sp. RF13]|uniref:peptide-methionine (S)-S-oxide reductase n=1 Tax=Frigidibacter sp. RF13 TaxID=2997340 RepID=UPI002271B44D|nr:peptide-methionine (S)-S-oxide reductase [Frigidibacter sp. RF13]MCY1125738.1 peptide-methionine (S)-S-oxide reductase [Frigidibacter sp. RF13]